MKIGKDLRNLTSKRASDHDSEGEVVTNRSIKTGTYVRNPAPWTDVNLGLAAEIRDESHGGCQVNGPKVAKFLDR